MKNNYIHVGSIILLLVAMGMSVRFLYLSDSTLMVDNTAQTVIVDNSR